MTALSMEKLSRGNPASVQPSIRTADPSVSDRLNLAEHRIPDEEVNSTQSAVHLSRNADVKGPAIQQQFQDFQGIL